MKKELKEKIQKKVTEYLRERMFSVDKYEDLEVKDTSFIGVERYEVYHQGVTVELLVEFDKIVNIMMYSLAS